LFEKLPVNAEILFCPTDEEFHGSMDSPPVRIHILGNLATPRSLVTLLHEVGHVFGDANLAKLGVESVIKPEVGSFRAEKLRKERSASAFAFKIIKSAIPESQLRSDARTFLKDYALTSYRMSIKEDLAEEARMSRFYRSEYDFGWEQGEDETRQRYDDFGKWRATDAFKKWKEIPENANLKEYSDEYIAWSEWVEKTGYDYYTDIYPEAGESI